MDTQLTPLVSKTQLKCVSQSSGSAIWCFAEEVSQRRSVTKPRTEVPSPKSQPGTVTGERAQKSFGVLHSWIDKWPNTISGDTCF